MNGRRRPVRERELAAAAGLGLRHPAQLRRGWGVRVEMHPASGAEGAPVNGRRRPVRERELAAAAGLGLRHPAQLRRGRGVRVEMHPAVERVVGSENRLAMAAGSVLLWEIREGAGRRTGERDGESKRKMR